MKTTTSAKSGKPAKVAKRLARDESQKSEPEVRVVKSVHAPSLSGHSDLSFEVGLDEAKNLRLRITGNSKAGAFCRDWIDLSAVLATLEKAPKGETVTSAQLAPLYRRRGANMPGFLWSLLLHEGLVRRSSTEKRRYEQVGPQERDAILKGLAEGKGAVDSKARKAKSTKAATEEKPSAATKNKKSPS